MDSGGKTFYFFFTTTCFFKITSSKSPIKFSVRTPSLYVFSASTSFLTLRTTNVLFVRVVKVVTEVVTVVVFISVVLVIESKVV